jgi:hypothetical protein
MVLQILATDPVSNTQELLLGPDKYTSITCISNIPELDDPVFFFSAMYFGQFLFQ